MKQVVVTGIGIATPGSIGKEEFWSNMREGRVFTGMLKAMDSKGIRCPVSAEIHEEMLLPYRKKITEAMGEELSRTEFLAVLATMLALEDSGISWDELRRQNIHAALGSTMGIEDSLLRKESEELLENPKQELVDRYAPINIVNTVKKYMEVTVCGGKPGGNITVRMFMNACAAGNYAIGDAFDEIRHGRCTAAVAGGVDALSYLAIVGFNRLLSVTPDVCRPFDKNRRGIVVGEGAGILVLEEKENAIKRGAHIYGEVSGCGLGADGYHITTPDPKGRGAIKAMKRALEQAGLSPKQVDYISAHGTGTAANDATEYVAACEVFGEHMPPISSIKSMIGHTMGAASAIEAAACCLMLDHGEMLPTANFVTPDEGCPVDCVPVQSRKAKLTHIMSNALAFGGNNSSIIFSKADARLQDEISATQENKRPPVFIFTHTIRKEEAEEYIERELPNINTGMADIQSLMLTAAIHRGMKENGINGLPEEKTALVSGSHSAAILSSIQFLLEVLKKGAIGASPMAFPNTVGNAPASRAAIWLDFRDKVVSLACEEERVEKEVLDYGKKLLEGDSLYALACDCSPDRVIVSLIGRGSTQIL